MANPIPQSRARGCFSLESFTRRLFKCNRHFTSNLTPLLSLRILPYFSHMEDADYQQKAIHAIAIIPHSVLDSSEVTMKE